MTEKHLSTQFDAELSGVSTRVLEMGGLVEAQVAQAIYALVHYSAETATSWRSRSMPTCRPSSPAASPPPATCVC